jgi:hypothetical protein
MGSGGSRVDTQRAMKDRSLPPGERGADLLLAHCAPLTDADLCRPPALLRLEEALGGKLTRLLVGALATRRGARPAVLPV